MTSGTANSNHIKKIDYAAKYVSRVLRHRAGGMARKYVPEDQAWVYLAEVKLIWREELKAAGLLYRRAVESDPTGIGSRHGRGGPVAAAELAGKAVVWANDELEGLHRLS